ncbi:chemotaxis protein CheW [Rhodobacterales bacterium HKCCE4037]|nr:chemotaxis protein CheW [Rhodobacterales bacterium HKCCE4037]
MADTFDKTRSSDNEVVAFRVNGQDFCCDIMSVREIRGWSETTILPHCEAFVKGVINLRGSVVPVIDLSARLGLGTTEPGPRNVIIIVVVEDQTVGLLADVVSDIISILDDGLQPVPEMAAASSGAFISGVLMLKDTMVRKLNLSSVLPQTRSVAA